MVEIPIILYLGYDSVADNGLIFDLLYLFSGHHLHEENTFSSSLLLGYQPRVQHKVIRNSNRGGSHFPHTFWSSYEYFSHCQSIYSLSSRAII
jgi:hypothetical protein